MNTAKFISGRKLGVKILSICGRSDSEGIDVSRKPSCKKSQVFLDKKIIGVSILATKKGRREERSVGARQQCQKVLPSSRHSRRNQRYSGK